MNSIAPNLDSTVMSLGPHVYFTLRSRVLNFDFGVASFDVALVSFPLHFDFTSTSL